jgi:hypothetical protein
LTWHQESIAANGD